MSGITEFHVIVLMLFGIHLFLLGISICLIGIFNIMVHCLQFACEVEREQDTDNAGDNSGNRCADSVMQYQRSHFENSRTYWLARCFFYSVRSIFR